MPASAPSSLLLQDLHCALGTRPVLQGLSARPLPGGQVVAVAGPNGAGKSTLLRCIAGFLPCQAERLELDGLDLRPLAAARRSATVRYLPQAAPGILHLNVYDCLRVALHAQGRPPADAAQRIASTAANLGLTDLLPRYLDELSGGQKQLVWLAQALLHQPRALLLDEPLAALDPNHQHHVMRLLRRLAGEQNLIIVVVLHDLNMAVRYADQVLVLHEGRIIAQGPAEEALAPAVLARAFRLEARVERCRLGTPFIIIDDLLML
ncbi:MAG: ABC transporter ATP-binding protein [Alcaligenaceae bacterium]|nr:ABC transporter ATP-binding protein [Alcaligenaceae bacterium]